jgi:hypothetical protein
MRNPIPTSRLFATPVDEADLFDRIEQMAGTEKALAYQVAMLTLNMCHNLVQAELAVDAQAV